MLCNYILKYDCVLCWVHKLLIIIKSIACTSTKSDINTIFKVLNDFYGMKIGERRGERWKHVKNLISIRLSGISVTPGRVQWIAELIWDDRQISM